MTTVILSLVRVLPVSIGTPASEVKATLTGIVSDGKSSPVQGARVLVSTADGERQDVLLTGPEGSYTFDGLQEGLYNLEFSARYFKRVLLLEVALRSGETTPRNVQLEVRRIDERLARATVETARQWKWDPLRLGDEPVESKTSVTVRFALE